VTRVALGLTEDDARSSPSQNPHVFIVGCPRSGTTLLGRMVDAHPEVAIIHESRWIPSWYRGRIGLTSDGMVTQEFVRQLSRYKRFPKLELSLDSVIDLIPRGDRMSYAEFTEALFDLYGQSRGKRLVGDKTPRYVRDIPTLHELFPRSRFVHIIRDGRDTVLSIMSWGNAGRTVGSFTTYARHPVQTTALWWEWQVRLGREAGARLEGSLYHELSYESFVADPAGGCRALCDFLGVSYDDSMLRFHQGKTRAFGLDAKKSWLPVTPGLRNWRAEMAATDVEVFEATAGELLAELGYERTTTPGRPAVARACALRERFMLELEERGRTVPAAWRSK
jgi:hypothetical protein